MKSFVEYDANDDTLEQAKDKVFKDTANGTIGFSSCHLKVPQNEFNFLVKVVSDQFLESQGTMQFGVRTVDGTARSGKDYVAFSANRVTTGYTEQYLPVRL